jgi:predicted SnoaL-like aldol condensation-catalyzing enzyme
MSDIERNKQIVLDFYQTAFSGNPEKAVTDHADPEYTQHNPVVQDGPDGVISFVTSLRGQYPNLRLDIKRALSGCWVLSVTRTSWGAEVARPTGLCRGGVSWRGEGRLSRSRW